MQQKVVLHYYAKTFPDVPLKETSVRTTIQYNYYAAMIAWIDRLELIRQIFTIQKAWKSKFANILPPKS